MAATAVAAASRLVVWNYSGSRTRQLTLKLAKLGGGLLRSVVSRETPPSAPSVFLGCVLSARLVHRSQIVLAN